MAFAAVQRVGKAQASGATLVIGAGDGWSTPAAGSLLVATANADATVTMTTVGFTAGPSVIDGNGAYLWWKIAAGTESSITFTPSSSAPIAGTICEYSGNAASPLDASNSSTIAGSAGTTTSAAAVVSTQAGDLVVGVAALHGGVGTPTGPGWTNSFVNQLSPSSGTGSGTHAHTFYSELMPAGAAGSYSTVCSWTNNMSDRQHLIVAFKESAAPTPAATWAPGTMHPGRRPAAQAPIMWQLNYEWTTPGAAVVHDAAADLAVTAALSADVVGDKPVGAALSATATMAAAVAGAKPVAATLAASATLAAAATRDAQAAAASAVTATLTAAAAREARPGAASVVTATLEAAAAGEKLAAAALPVVAALAAAAVRERLAAAQSVVTVALVAAAGGTAKPVDAVLVVTATGSAAAVTGLATSTAVTVTLSAAATTERLGAATLPVSAAGVAAVTVTRPAGAALVVTADGVAGLAAAFVAAAALVVTAARLAGLSSVPAYEPALVGVEGGASVSAAGGESSVSAVGGGASVSSVGGDVSGSGSPN